MSSHVVVIDASARRAVIKTNPAKFLIDVHQEACAKFGVDPNCHGLKSNNKTIDLSQPIRLSGLSSGAKLQLVVSSRSPSVVSVALKLPESEGANSDRLTDKFPSTTTLWLLLRKFESDPGVSNGTRNFTARALPHVDNEESGPGRLFYQTPVIHVMGRELVSFTDLQKTLAQLGFNSGSVLLRLSFRSTNTPLEEAMMEIDLYFKSVEGDSISGADARDVGKAESTPETAGPVFPQDESDTSLPPEPLSPQPTGSSSANQTNTSSTPKPQDSTTAADETITGPYQRPITVFAPPSASTPAAARQAFNEKDYEPTIDHAKLHQSRLATYGRNKTLPSDAELEAQREAQARKRSEIKSAKIKTRFPDQSTVISEFSNVDTTDQLYEHVRRLLENESEPFSLNFSTTKGPQNISKEGHLRLISDLGMIGNVLVNVIWEEGASSEARAGKVLKERYREQATEIDVRDITPVDVDDGNNGGIKGKRPEKREGEKKGGMPKWLKLPGKK